jgi:tRNA(Ile)-lysidine synthetase-like protein
MLPTTPPEPLILGFRRSGLIRPGVRLLVAVSGGPDSTALLVAAREQGEDVVAAHYDHALQPGSAAASDYVAELCRQLDMELISERRGTAVPRGSLQAAARALRYEFLERARIDAGAHVVALGHTADDLIEGVVLHLMRGCGLSGLRGMPASRGVFVRPLLAVSRRDVVAFLEQRGITALEDPANSNHAYARVRVRREILPALERDRPGISRRFYGAAMQAAALQDSIAAQAASAFVNGPLSRATVASAPEPVGAELMKMLYVRAGGALPALSRAHVQSMLRLAQPGRGGRGVDLPRRLRLRIVGETMEIVASKTSETGQGRQGARLSITQCSGCDDREVAHLGIGLPLRLGFRSPGLTMRPRGGRGSRKLQDIFVDARVPREDRDAWPLVFAGDRLAWVPGVAVDADLSSAPGMAAQHVAVISSEVERPKFAVLKSPQSPSGVPS